ncbi:hypothetical protein [Nocardioides marmoraquaticus]
MSLTKLTRTATRTATGAVRLGAGVAARAFGLAKGAAEVGVAVARDAASRGDAPVPAPTQRSQEPAATPEPVRPTEPARDDPRDHIPGPDVVAPDLPRAEDLPEPVVIEAVDEPGEAFHHEPKAAGRDSEHEGRPGDREEAEGYLEEVVDPDAPEVDVETPVGTTGADVATNPDTAESDLQQPGTPPLADPSTIAAVVSESETLRRAGERDPGA